MTWGHTTASEHVVKITRLDRTGIPSVEHQPVTGRGARSWNVQTDPGEPDLDLDPDYPLSVRTGNLRVHVATQTDDMPAFVGLGNFAVEVFTPGPDHTWLYCLFPTLIGRCIAFRTTDGRASVTVHGRTKPNPMLGTLTEGFTADNTATMLTGVTRINPLVPA